ncbi:MAG TPA: hypothetical protein VMI32_21070 [Candidatus Solibacter sp.]|nr:hypothetical protein [Candidatus Solibacter sp.]
MKRARFFLGFSILLTALAFVLACPAAAEESCEPPADLKPVLQKAFPNKRVVGLPDLDKDDLELWEKDHGKSCPGFVQVDFYGDAKPTWAIVLFGADSKSVNGITAVLVLAHKPDTDWKIKTVETTSGIPVVWKEKPGTYTGLYKEKTIHASHPVIIFCGYNSWAILYAWTGASIAKTWLSD